MSRRLPSAPTILRPASLPGSLNDMPVRVIEAATGRPLVPVDPYVPEMERNWEIDPTTGEFPEKVGERNYPRDAQVRAAQVQEYERDWQRIKNRHQLDIDSRGAPLMPGTARFIVDAGYRVPPMNLDNYAAAYLYAPGIPERPTATSFDPTVRSASGTEEPLRPERHFTEAAGSQVADILCRMAEKGEQELSKDNILGVLGQRWQRLNETHRGFLNDVDKARFEQSIVNHLQDWLSRQLAYYDMRAGQCAENNPYMIGPKRDTKGPVAKQLVRDSLMTKDGLPVHKRIIQALRDLLHALQPVLRAARFDIPPITPAEPEGLARARMRHSLMPPSGAPGAAHFRPPLTLPMPRVEPEAPRSASLQSWPGMSIVEPPGMGGPEVPPSPHRLRRPSESYPSEHKPPKKRFSQVAEEEDKHILHAWHGGASAAPP